MKEYKVNENITLKLEERVTYIYINGVRSKRSIGLFIKISPDRPLKYNQFELLDEAVEGLQSYTDIYSIADFYDNRSRGRVKYNITAEQEFWAHCSNIQVWVENDYDMSLIHSSLGYKLLKSLSNHGIEPAKERYKKEIIKRFRTGHIESSFYLLEENFHKRFSKKERFQFFLKSNPRLKVNINYDLSNYNPESPLIKIKKPTIGLLKKLKIMGDSDAKTILANYINRIKSRSPKILTVNKFWEIIKNSLQESKGDPWEQERLLFQHLKNRSIDEIYLFRDFFSYFESLLNKDSLLSGLVNEFDVYISDDTWKYRRGHIVAMGKDLYEMALYNTDKFIEVLKTGIYGDPENIRHEFWAVTYNAFEEKTGLTSDDLDNLISEDLHEESAEIFKKLRENHIDIIKKRIESKDPQTIANLAYDNFFDYLPKQDLVKILLDEDLNDIWIEGYFDFGVFSDQYLSKLEVSISEVIRDIIVESIKDNDLEALLNFFGKEVFSNLTEEDFLIILSRSKSNFVEIMMKALQETKKHKYLLEECMIFTSHLNEKLIQLIKAEATQYINSINNRKVKIDWEILIKSGILEILDNRELVLLFENEDFKLLEKIVSCEDENYFEIGECFYIFLEKRKLTLTTQILKFVSSTLINNKKNLFKSILKSPLLHFLTDRDLISLFENPNFQFLEKILEIIKTIEYLDEFGPIFQNEFLKKNFEYLLKKFKDIGNNDDLLQMFRLGIFKHKDVSYLLEEFKLQIVDILMDLKAGYFEEVESWIFNYIEDLSKKGILKKYLLETIKNDDKKSFIRFFENYMFGYLDDKSIIDMFQNEDFGFFEYFFQVIKDTNSDFVIYGYFNYPETILEELKPIMIRKINNYIINDNIYQLTLILALRTFTRLYEVEGIKSFFIDPEIDFFSALAKVLYYNSSSYTDNYLAIDVDLIDQVYREINEILDKFESSSPTLLKNCVIVALSNPNQFTLLFIVSHKLLKCLPPTEFILILEENRKDVFDKFLNAVALEENVTGGKSVWIREYLKKILPKLKKPIREKLKSILKEG